MGLSEAGVLGEVVLEVELVGVVVEEAFIELVAGLDGGGLDVLTAVVMLGRVEGPVVWVGEEGSVVGPEVLGAVVARVGVVTRLVATGALVAARVVVGRVVVGRVVVGRVVAGRVVVGRVVVGRVVGGAAVLTAAGLTTAAILPAQPPVGP